MPQGRKSRTISDLEKERRKTEEDIRRWKSYLDDEHENERVGQDDAATVIYEREKTLALIKTLQEKLLSIEHALQQVDDGGYGVCEGCGKSIDPERLEILPEATLCVQCQAKQEAGPRRTRRNH